MAYLRCLDEPDDRERRAHDRHGDEDLARDRETGLLHGHPRCADRRPDMTGDLRKRADEIAADDRGANSTTSAAQATNAAKALPRSIFRLGLSFAATVTGLSAQDRAPVSEELPPRERLFIVADLIAHVARDRLDACRR